MARWRYRYDKEGFYRTIIVMMLMTSGANCLLAALFESVTSGDVFWQVVLGIVMFGEGFIWLVEDSYKNGHTRNKFSDMLVAFAGFLLLFGWMMLQHWLLAAILIVECLLIGRFYFRNRPKRR